MSGPGKGRYTTYVANSAKTPLLSKLYNSRAAAGIGVIYGGADEKDNSKAAASVVKTASELLSAGVGDPSYFPNGVNMSYQGTSAVSVPDQTRLSWKSPGDAVGGYVPDVTSPGATADGSVNVDPTTKTNPVSLDDMLSVHKEQGIPGQTVGTTTPASTSKSVTIGSDLEMGKSSV